MARPRPPYWRRPSIAKARRTSAPASTRWRSNAAEPQPSRLSTDFETLGTSRRVDRNMFSSAETTGSARGRYAAVGWNTGMAVYQKRHSGEYPEYVGRVCARDRMDVGV